MFHIGNPKNLPLTTIFARFRHIFFSSFCFFKFPTFAITKIRYNMLVLWKPLLQKLTVCIFFCPFVSFEFAIVPFCFLFLGLWEWDGLFCMPTNFGGNCLLINAWCIFVVQLKCFERWNRIKNVAFSLRAESFDCAQHKLLLLPDYDAQPQTSTLISLVIMASMWKDNKYQQWSWELKRWWCQPVQLSGSWAQSRDRKVEVVRWQCRGNIKRATCLVRVVAVVVVVK